MFDLDNLIKKYYPYSTFIAGLMMFIFTTSVCLYLIITNTQISLMNAFKEIFSNIRMLYLMGGSTFITVMNIKKKYGHNNIEYSDRTCVILALINLALFIFTFTLVYLQVDEVYYKILMFVLLLYVGTFSQAYKKGYKSIFERIIK